MNHPSSDLRARVLAAAAAAPSLDRKRGRRAMLGAVVASIVVAAGCFELMGGLAHSEGRPRALTAAIAGGWALASAAFAWVTFGRARSTLARRPVVTAAVAVAAPLACFAWMHLFSGAYVEPFERIGLRCLAMTIGVAAIPLGAFLALRRGVEPRFPAALGAAAGATTGAMAGVLVDLWCPLTNDGHVLRGHVFPLIVLAIAGALVGRKTLGVRALS